MAIQLLGMSTLSSKKFLGCIQKSIQHLSLKNKIPDRASLSKSIKEMIFFDKFIQLFYFISQEKIIVKNCKQIESLKFNISLYYLLLQVNDGILNLLQSQKAQMKNNTSNQLKCCICFSYNCQESIDHFPYSIQQLTQLINKSKKNQNIIDPFKTSIKQAYNSIKDQFLLKLQKDERKFQQWINQFYFIHLADNINKSLLSQLAQANYQQLPNKSLSKLIKALKSNQNEALNKIDLPSSFYEAKRFIERVDADNITDKSIRMLAVERVIKSAQVSLLSLCSKRSISQINPQQYQQIPQAYEWKNVKLNKNSRTVELSNKNLKDQDLIKQIPQISSFKNIKQFEIRNNLITALSCKIIVNNLKFISCLDIRGNMVGDIGLQYIIKGMPQLKNLLISQTGATDKAGLMIVDHLDNLELFWGEHNRFTGEVVLAIGSKPKIKVMSVVGNPIDKKYSSILNGLFSRKGYVVV